MINNVINNVGSVGSVGSVGIAVARKKLLEVLDICKQISGKYARVTLSDRTIYLETINKGIMARAFIEYSKEQNNLAFTIPVKKTLDFLKSSNGDIVTISDKKIEDNNGNFVTFESPVEYCTIIPQNNRKYLFALSGQQFIDLFQQVNHHSAKYNLLVFDETKITTMATVGDTILSNTIYKYTTRSGRYVIYAKSINIAIKLLKSKIDALVTIELCDENGLMIDIGNVQIVSSIIDYQFTSLMQ